MRSVPLPFLSKITLLWTRAREPGPVSPVKVDSPLPFPWTQRGEIYIFVAFEDNHIVAYCTLTKTDCIPNVPYTPYIGYMFVGEQYRGRRISQKLINFVLEYAKGLHFNKVYLVSDHINLYEKYGFIKIDEKPAPWNPDINETIFMHLI